MTEDDDEIDKAFEELDNLSVKDLQLLLNSQELSASGRGAELRSRIKELFGLENKDGVSNKGKTCT